MSPARSTMSFSVRTRHLLVTTAILVASAIQLLRGYKLWVVLVGAFAFLLLGNLTVWLSDTKARAIRRKAYHDYYAN